MGSMSNFNSSARKVSELVKKYSIDVFCETGCFRGNTLRYMKQFGFEKMYSCDIDKQMINICRNISPNLELFHGTSIEFLEFILPKLENKKVLFYLDAHLPEFDKSDGKKLTDSKHNFPLTKEIDIIHKYRGAKDVIVCDDLRLYEDGPFSGGNWPKRKEFPELDLAFLKQYNYNIEKFYSQEGYLLLTPSN